MCDRPGKYRFTWPGTDEAVICEAHVGWLRQVADAMGLHLQIIELTETELAEGKICNQANGDYG